MIVTAVIVNILLSLTVVCEINPYAIPYIINQDEQSLHVVENEKVSLICDVRCINCSQEDIIVEWEKDGQLQVSLVNITNYKLIINSYQSNQHNGSYACIVKYKGLGIRSKPWYLHNINPPKFLLEGHETLLHDTVVFKCIDVTSHIRDKVEIQWLKDGKYFQTFEKNNYGSEVLILSKTTVSNTGLYACKYKFRNTVDWYYSDSVTLNVTSKVGASQPHISYVTKSATVELNQSINISCVARSLNTIVKIFRVSANNYIEMKVAENTGSAHFALTRFNYDKAGTYICEAEINHIRARREIQLDLALKPVFKVRGLTHLDSKTGSKITFECQPNFASDFNTAWYYNGVPYTPANGVLLTLTKLSKSHSGIYQCVVENNHGSDSKMFYLSVGNSGLAPYNLQVTKITPVMVRLSWNSSTATINDENISFQVQWIDPSGHEEGHVTNKTELIIDQKLYGGVLYKFRVCTLHSLEKYFRDCVFTKKKMLELPPTESPYLYKVLVDKDVIKINWNPIPYKTSLGIIRNYTIFCQQVLSHSLGPLKSFTVNGNETSAKIPFLGIMFNKIWMHATNTVGQSPNSSVYIVATENDDTEMTLSASWSFGDGASSRRPELTWTLLRDSKNITHFQIFYVKFPYKNYWDSVKTITVSDKSKRKIYLKNLTSSETYRLTIAPVYKFVNEFRETSYYYGRRTHAILHEDLNFNKSFKKSLFQFDEIKAPENLKCSGLNRNSILISWHPPPRTKYSIKNYIVYIKSEKSSVETIYSVVDSHLLLHNLTDTWYIVRVHADNEKLNNNVVVYEAGYISCRTKIDTPSAPLNVSYNIIYVHMDIGVEKKMFLVAKWKPPLYTGESIYSYDVTLKEKAIEGIPFPFIRKVYKVLLEERSDEWIYSVPMTISGPGVEIEIQITPFNDVGQGKKFSIKTAAIYEPKLDSQNRPTVDSTNNLSLDISTGVVIGIAVSAFFLLIFIIVCIIKEPLKRRKESQNIRNERDDSYLYLERLKIVPEESMTSQKTISTDRSTYLSHHRNKKRPPCNGYNLMKPSLNCFVWRPSTKRDDSTSTQQDIFSRSSSSSCNYNHILSCMCCDVDRGPRCCSKCRQNSTLYGSSASGKRDSKDSMVKIYSTNSSKTTNQDSTTSINHSSSELVGACSLLYRQGDL